MTERSGTINIRKATKQDAAPIAAIYNESILEFDSTMIDVPLTESDIVTSMRFSSDREGYYVLTRDESVVGWGMIKPYGEGPAFEYTCETSVFLSRSELGRGYGTRLNKHLLDRCAAFGYHHLVVKIWASNTRSNHHFRKLGYQTVGVQHEIGRMNNTWIDVVIMQYLVPS